MNEDIYLEADAFDVKDTRPRKSVEMIIAELDDEVLKQEMMKKWGVGRGRPSKHKKGWSTDIGK
jgi:hypothetical protein